MAGEDEHSFAAIELTFKRVVGALDEAGVPYLVGGTLASWARGGHESRHDLDFMVREEDSERALEALAAAGMRPDRPPEPWLVKAWDGDVLVDLIHHPKGVPITDEVLARGEDLDVAGMRAKVMSLEDVLTSKLLVLGEHSLDLESPLQIARSLRENIDFGQVRARIAHSPYARAFFALVENLGIVEPQPSANGGHEHGRTAHVRVVEPLSAPER